MAGLCLTNINHLLLRGSWGHCPSHDSLPELKARQGLKEIILSSYIVIAVYI